MSGKTLRTGAELKRTLPWFVLTIALILATMPAWRPMLFGIAPSLDDLLTLRCFSR